MEDAVFGGHGGGKGVHEAKPRETSTTLSRVANYFPKKSMIRTRNLRCATKKPFQYFFERLLEAGCTSKGFKTQEVPCMSCTVILEIFICRLVYQVLDGQQTLGQLDDLQ